MQSEPYEYYSKAPVFAWSLAKSEDGGIEQATKKFHSSSKCDFFDHSEPKQRAESILSLFNWCVSEYEAKLKSEVEVIFK